MIIQLIKIGNSKGIILPKTILTQMHISNEIVLETVDDAIIIKPSKANNRDNWEESFKMVMPGKKSKKTSDIITNKFDELEWEW
jgi:antitoxin MazE